MMLTLCEKWGLTSLSQGAAIRLKNTDALLAAWTERSVPIFRHLVAHSFLLNRHA
jgi:hypothetical protein